MSVTNFLGIAAAGLVCMSLLSWLVNNGPRAWWKLPICLSLNVALGAGHVNVLKRGAFFYWEFEQGILALTPLVIATATILILFHAWLGVRAP